ncbi:MAG: MCE family protein [Roseivivax sp.]|nr:MCE family protein [Roseivivax sp.]
MTTPPDVTIEPVRRSLWERASVVWLVPLAALAIALGVAWQHFASRGPLIEVTFEEAQGIHARETDLRYRDVTVGVVEEVAFSSDLGRVTVKIRLDKAIADYVDDDAQFWVVKPQVTTQGVSGLDTVLSGVFIEGVWDTAAEGLVDMHEGLDEPPLLRPGEKGTIVTLRALPGAGLTESTPILYKGIAVGRVGAPDLTPGGGAAVAEGVIYAPYDRLLTSATRFWDVSGISFSLGAGGVELDFSSIASLIAGGVAFDTLASGGVPLTKKPVFDVYQGGDDARESLFNDNTQPGVNMTIVFNDNVSGLAIGAPVEFGGLTIGKVISLTGILDPLRFRDRRVRLLVNVEIKPGQLGLGDDAGEAEVLEFFDIRAQQGLRARLATASILTGGLKIEFIDLPTATEDSLDYSGDPFPVFPSTKADVADAAATAEGVLTRINSLPIEELLQSAIRFMESATDLTSDPSLRKVPDEVAGLLTDVRGLVGAPEMQALPGQVGAVMDDLRATMGDLRRVVTNLEEAQAVERLLAAVDSAGQAADAVTSSVDGMPELLETLNGVAKKAEALPLEELMAQATQVVNAADTLLRDEGLQSLPEQLGAALDQVRLALAELRDGGTVENLNATLASARQATAAVEQATTELPKITRRLDQVLAQAEETLKSLAPNSELNRAAQGALTEVGRAARAVESLSRTLERKPNSIILGR